MRQIHSYVVRIYRQDSVAVAGLIEDVETGRAVPFQSLGELGDILTGRKPFPRRAARRHEVANGAPPVTED